MRKRRVNALILGILPLLFACLVFGEVVDKIAIIVNDEIICDSEIERLLIPVYANYKASYSGDELLKKLEEARQRIVEQLIEDKLVMSEAKKQNIEASEMEIEERIEDARKHFGSIESFEAALAEQRLTVKDLRARYREQIMTRRMIDQKVGSGIIITPIEVSNYYNSHISEFARVEALKLRNILIRPKEGEDASPALELAKEILNKLREGADFAQTARTYSQGPGAEEGGMMEYVDKADLMPEINKAVSGLKAGELSDIVQTALGYHIFKVEEKKEAGTLSFSEARRAVEEIIYRQKVKEKIRGWVESLKKNAYIAFK